MNRVGCVLPVLLFTGLQTFGMPVFSASELASARVSVVPAVTINQQAEIDFGQLNNVNGICTMSTGGALSGSEGMDCNGAETPGLFTVSGLNGAAVSISVSHGQLPGIAFTPQILGGASQVLVNGSIDVTVVGSLELNNTSDGDKNISYIISANYE